MRRGRRRSSGTSRRSHRGAAWVILLVLALVVAACGGDADEATGDDESPPAGDEATDVEDTETDDGEAAAWEPTRDVEWIIPFGPGGGYDAYSRQIAEVANQNHMPDGIRIQVRNVEGAGGRVGAETLKRAEPDGHTIGVMHNINLAVNEIETGDEATISLTDDFTWLVGITREPYVLFAPQASGITSVDDLRERSGSVRMGSVSAASPQFVIGVILGDVLDLEVDHVTAYPGAGDLLNGAIRGDVDLSALEASSINQYVESGDLVPLLVFGDERSDLFPDAPTAEEEGIENAAVLSMRPVAGPAGLPDEIASYWEETLLQVMNDPDLLAWSEEAQRAVAPSDLEDTRQRVVGTFEFMQQFGDQIRAAFEEVGN